MTGLQTARRATPPARRAFFLLTLAAALFAAVPASPASAHAFLEASSPSDGAVLKDAPAQLRLQFSEGVLLEATRIDIVDGDGHQYAPTGLRLDESADPGSESQTIVATLPALPKNAYRVSWATLASDDLHRTKGVLVFGIAQPVTAAGLSEPAPRPDEATLRWLVFLAFALALGGGFAARLFRRQGAAAAAAAARSERWAAVGALAGAVVALALLVDQVVASGSSAGRLLFSSYGQHWLLREVGFALLLIAALGGRRVGAGSARQSILRVAGAVAVSIGAALLGHAAAGNTLGVTGVAAEALHLAAAGIWAGTLIVLGLVGVPLLRAGGALAVSGRSALRAFGWPAAICISVMVVTGVYLVSSVVGSVDAALLTFYGRTLLLKLTVVAVAGGLGLVNVVRLHRRPAERTPRRTVLVEGAAAISILLLAAVLTSSQPAMEPQLIRTATPASVPVVDGQAADLQETLAIRPNMPGRNMVLLGVFDTRRPSPAPIIAVNIAFIGVDGAQTNSAAAERLADGRWAVPVELSTAGPTRVRITARRAGFPDATRTYDWTVGGAPAVTRSESVSNAPIAGILKAASGLLAVVLLAAWAAVWVRRRRVVVTPLVVEQDAEVDVRV